MSNSLLPIVLAFIGLSSGTIAAAGIFAFLAIIGVYPRVIGRTDTKMHILLYETMIILGGILGNIADLYELPIRFGGSLMLGMFGLSVGIFVGCLAMSLAETLKAYPILIRRVHLAVGIRYMILAMGLGKMFGSLIYFARGMG